MRVLTMVTAGLGRPPRDELIRLEKNDLYPRTTIFEREMSSDILDERWIDQQPPLRRLIYPSIPTYLAQAIEAFRLRHRYDLIISWAAQLGLPFAALCRLNGQCVPHLMLESWISRPKKARLLALLHPHIDRIVLWSTVQRDYVLNKLHIPAPKIAFVNWYVDQQFFRPHDFPTEMICSVGSEMRDYRTLIEALRPLPIRCHIAAGTLRDRNSAEEDLRLGQPSRPVSISVGFKSYPELRQLYARSRFVVVPLKMGDTDNGITTILESMASGKAVICTRTEGQVDVVVDGVNGLYVPVGDVRSMREAIVFLWNNPDVADAMGKRGRQMVEKRFTIDRFISRIREIAQEVVEESRSRKQRSSRQRGTQMDQFVSSRGVSVP